MCRLNHIPGVTKALRCQQAEHSFCDTPCGIMDQYISTMGQPGNLLLIDCRSNSFELVPFGTPLHHSSSSSSPVDGRSPVLLVINSNVKHSLSSSEYPVRVKQCQAAVTVLAKTYPHIRQLRDATMAQLDSVWADLSSSVGMRARHCITEDTRTLAAVEALRQNNFKLVGKLMTESHFSLQNDYQVSCPELDLLVELALQTPGVLGSRMTGGGFGGCTVTLVERDSVLTLEKFISKEYKSRTGRDCVCFQCTPSVGCGVYDLGNNKSGVATSATKGLMVSAVMTILFALIAYHF